MNPLQTTVDIDRLAAGGDGVGRVDGKVCFVPMAAPGDRLRIALFSQNRNFLRGRILEIISAGPGRRPPVCAHFGSCGGCQWLHLDETVQCAAKQQILAHALKRSDVAFVPSSEALHYRQQVRLHLEPQKPNLPAIGFADNKGRQIVDLAMCPIMAPLLLDCVFALRESLFSCVEHPAEVRLSMGRNGIALALESNAAPGPRFFSLSEKLVPHPLCGMVVLLDRSAVSAKGASAVELEGADGLPLCTPITSFGQANRQANRSLFSQVARWLDDRHYRRILELFAGSGNLTCLLAERCGRMTAVEIDAAACRMLRENLQRRGLRGINVINGDAFYTYQSLKDDFDLVVLDPPRTGHLDLARALAKGNHRAILYVSCDPATLARDLKELIPFGFALSAALGADMFPQTSHIEAAVLLER